MRFKVVLTIAVAALVTPARPARSQPPQQLCPLCVPVVSGLSATSMSIAASIVPGAAVPNAATSNCVVEYKFGGLALHSVSMTKSPSGFSGSILAIPPATVVQHRVVCDGRAGSFHSVKTLPSSAAAPTPPSVPGAKRVGLEALSFSFTSDPSEPTAFWVESRSSAVDDWQLDPDIVGTFAQKRISVLTASRATRVGVRNSAGIVYSSVVP